MKQVHHELSVKDKKLKKIDVYGDNLEIGHLNNESLTSHLKTFEDLC